MCTGSGGETPAERGARVQVPASPEALQERGWRTECNDDQGKKIYKGERKADNYLGMCVRCVQCVEWHVGASSSI